MERSVREFQVNVHPNDIKYFPKVFAHQQRVWGPQVDRFRVTLDVHNSASGRYRSTSHEENLRQMMAYLEAISASNNRVQFDVVDYSSETRNKIAKHFFGIDDVPIKAWDGGPLYSYMFGIWSSRADILVHVDSDMMFGGGSEVWLDEAVGFLSENETCMFVAPLAGPPHPDGPQGANLLQPKSGPRIITPGVTYGFDSVSTRILATDLRRFGSQFLPLNQERPTSLQALKARLLGNPTELREFEHILSTTLRSRGMFRADYLGGGKGMWSLHPPFRNAQFYADLDAIIDRIERADMPPEQLGRYDMCDELCDWSAVRAQKTRSRRIAGQAKQAVTRHFS